jgi:adenylate cyclase
MTDQRGDLAATELARAFRRTMCALSREHGARQVKSMGDGVMIWAPDAARAIELAADAVDRVGSRPDLLPIRVGVHTGRAEMRGCDWYGRAVNLAARLAREAEPNEALVSDATREAARPGGMPQLVDCRRLTLRGLAGRVSAWRLAPAAPAGAPSQAGVAMRSAKR